MSCLCKFSLISNLVYNHKIKDSRWAYENTSSGGIFKRHDFSFLDFPWIIGR